uniref:Uncharacterized protein n=1 Tax=uncultured bacterium contig00025 TaxID=1181514 RepID=A0A806KFK1_9BACT|nr:hypothetical protein [uncultured bacterium contig00025]
MVIRYFFTVYSMLMILYKSKNKRFERIGSNVVKDIPQ